MGIGVLISEVLVGVVELELSVDEKVAMVVGKKRRLVLAACYVRSDELIVNSLRFGVNHGLGVDLIEVSVFGFDVEVKLQVLVLRVTGQNGNHFETNEEPFPPGIIFRERKNVLSQSWLTAVLRFLLFHSQAENS